MISKLDYAVRFDLAPIVSEILDSELGVSRHIRRKSRFSKCCEAEEDNKGKLMR